VGRIGGSVGEWLRGETVEGWKEKKGGNVKRPFGCIVHFFFPLDVSSLLLCLPAYTQIINC
jgi:hypothetical protein